MSVTSPEVNNIRQKLHETVVRPDKIKQMGTHGESQ